VTPCRERKTEGHPLLQRASEHLAVGLSIHSNRRPHADKLMTSDETCLQLCQSVSVQMDAICHTGLL